MPLPLTWAPNCSYGRGLAVLLHVPVLLVVVLVVGRHVRRVRVPSMRRRWRVHRATAQPLRVRRG